MRGVFVPPVQSGANMEIASNPNTVMSMVHVGLGVAAVMAGAVAFIARKGARAHILAGRLFVASMALSCTLGAILGLVKFETLYITSHAGILAFTLVISGWITVRTHSRRMARAMRVIGVVNAMNAIALIVAGLRAQAMTDGVLFGFPAEDYFFLAAMAGLALVGDAKVLIGKDFSNRNRIARHLWRMCLGFFIAAGSAFTGPGANAFPEAIRHSGLLALPELIIITLMLFWLGNTYFRSGARRQRSV